MSTHLQTPVSTDYEAGWAPNPAWTPWQRKVSLKGIKPLIQFIA